MDKQSIALRKFEEGFKAILDGMKELGYRAEDDPNLVDTAARAARGLAELVLDHEEVRSQVEGMLAKTFPASYQEMVISKHNVAFGLCPHHLLPVIYRVSVAYIPRSKVLGISKLSRIVKLLARAPLLQEDLTHNVARLLHEDIDSDGSAVYVEGLHLCMASRGSSTHEARVVTSAVRGVFLDQLATREEFIKLVTASHPTLV
jgi:GTP cyclohydrolase IA